MTTTKLQSPKTDHQTNWRHRSMLFHIVTGIFIKNLNVIKSLSQKNI